MKTILGVWMDHRNSMSTGHLHAYDDAAMAATRDAESILIFGPGDAKGELQSRLEKADLGGRIAAVETVDRMNDRQVAAKVREYVHESRMPGP
jgi:hypothetical protein